MHLLQCLPALWAVMLEQFLRAVTACEGWYSMLEQRTQHAAAVPSRKFPFSSDQGSQPGLGTTSTRLSDRPGTLSQRTQHAAAIPSRKFPFSSDQGSQTGLGTTSTRLSDRPGTLSAVVFMHKPHNGAKQPVLLPILLLLSHSLLFHLQLAGPSMHTQSVWPHSATGL